MFSFFGALFGGAYLAGKLGNEKARAKAYQRNRDREAELAEKFYHQYSVSLEETHKVEGMVLSLDPEMTKFKNELTQIVGTTPTHPMLIWGFLAKRGKIPNWAIASDYNADNVLSYRHDNTWKDVTVWKSIGINELRKARLKFLIWYDEELRKNGMKYNLMYIPAHYIMCGKGNLARPEIYYHIDDMKPISDCHDLCPQILNYHNIKISLLATKNFPVMVLWEPTKLHVPDVLGVV